MAASNAGKSVLARRYAKALFECAVEEKSLKSVEKDVADLSKTLEASEDLSRALTSPVVSKARADKILSAIFKKAKLSKITEQFASVLNNNRRLNILPQVLVAFEEKAAEARGEVNIDVVAASKLNKESLKKISDSVAKLAGKKVKVSQEVDESIIGGVVVKIGSSMIDASVKGKLDRLELHLKNNDAA